MNEILSEEMKESMRQYAQIQDKLRELAIEWNNSVRGLRIKQVSLGNYGFVDYDKKTIRMPMFTRGCARGEKARRKLESLAEELGFSLVPDPD